MEPAYEGQKNGVSLRVTKRDSITEPVEGLEDTLQVEVTHLPSDTSREMPLRTIFGDPGHYTADLIPTAPGHYRFRFFGTCAAAATSACSRAIASARFISRLRCDCALITTTPVRVTRWSP